MTTLGHAAPLPVRSRVTLADALTDTLVITRRNLVRVVRLPQLLLFSTVQPIMFLLLFAFSLSWVMATIGLLARNPEAAQSAVFLPTFPLVFASSVFLPTQTMPGWLRVFADNQQVTVITNAGRHQRAVVAPGFGPVHRQVDDRSGRRRTRGSSRRRRAARVAVAARARRRWRPRRAAAAAVSRRAPRSGRRRRSRAGVPAWPRAVRSRPSRRRRSARRLAACPADQLVVVLPEQARLPEVEQQIAQDERIIAAKAAFTACMDEQGYVFGTVEDNRTPQSRQASATLDRIEAADGGSGLARDHPLWLEHELAIERFDHALAQREPAYFETVRPIENGYLTRMAEEIQRGDG